MTPDTPASLLASLDQDTEIHDVVVGAWTLRLIVRDGDLDEAGWRVGGVWWQSGSARRCDSA